MPDTASVKTENTGNVMVILMHPKCTTEFKSIAFHQKLIYQKKKKKNIHSYTTNITKHEESSAALRIC